MSSIKTVAPLALLLAFGALTAWAAVTGSTGALIGAHMQNPWSVQITVDLCIAGTFGVLWMWRDAKERGLDPRPWAIATVFTGSLALLAYAVRRGFAQPSRQATAKAALAR